MKRVKKRQFKEDHSDDFSGQRRGKPSNEDFNEKNIKKENEEYRCGKEDCLKYYHSYTAFYNHCKKVHEGEFPENSLLNGKLFQGPSKNRGRPKIKKTDAKDTIQIESLKTENELIEFLGTLPRKKKDEDERLIVYVDDPIEQLQTSLELVRKWTTAFDNYLENLNNFNKVVTRNDLPEFYDPIEIQTFVDNLDSYSVNSIYKFFTDPTKQELHRNQDEGEELMEKILIAWLSRIISTKLLAEVVFVIAQNKANVGSIKEKDLLSGNSKKFLSLMYKYITCLLNEQKEPLK